MTCDTFTSFTRSRGLSILKVFKYTYIYICILQGSIFQQCIPYDGVVTNSNYCLMSAHAANVLILTFGPDIFLFTRQQNSMSRNGRYIVHTYLANISSISSALNVERYSDYEVVPLLPENVSASSGFTERGLEVVDAGVVYLRAIYVHTTTRTKLKYLIHITHNRSRRVVEVFAVARIHECNVCKCYEPMTRGWALLPKMYYSIMYEKKSNRVLQNIC